MYRFLLRPRWIAFTIGIIALMVALVNLGLWQLRRLDERRSFNAIVTSRENAPVTDPAGLPSDPQAAQWRRIQMTGTWEARGQVLIRDRSLDGEAGLHVVTPLAIAGGPAVLVNRGFIPITAQDRPPAPASGTVTVVARVRVSQKRGTFGATDPAGGTLAILNRVDVPRIQAQADLALAPYYVELVSEDPAPAPDAPRPLPLPALDEGPHLSYAVQWFLFTVCAAVGWVVVVRKSAGGARRERARERANGPAPG